LLLLFTENAVGDTGIPAWPPWDFETLLLCIGTIIRIIRTNRARRFY
jgi:hypothetical protein